LPCVVANATPDCASRRCAIRSCNDGFGDCNGDPIDGCETDVLRSPLHCSKCNLACPPGTSCVDGRCG
jgi:hypothetical protein